MHSLALPLLPLLFVVVKETGDLLTSTFPALDVFCIIFVRLHVFVLLLFLALYQIIVVYSLLDGFLQDTPQPRHLGRRGLLLGGGLPGGGLPGDGGLDEDVPVGLRAFHTLNEFNRGVGVDFSFLQAVVCYATLRFGATQVAFNTMLTDPRCSLRMN